MSFAHCLFIINYWKNYFINQKMLYKYYFEKELSSAGLHQKLASKLNVFY